MMGFIVSPIMWLRPVSIQTDYPLGDVLHLPCWSEPVLRSEQMTLTVEQAGRSSVSKTF